MNHWNEEDRVYEFKVPSPAEAAKRSTATDASLWVRRQLEWCAMDVVRTPESPLDNQMVGQRHVPVLA